MEKEVEDAVELMLFRDKDQKARTQVWTNKINLNSILNLKCSKIFNIHGLYFLLFSYYHLYHFHSYLNLNIVQYNQSYKFLRNYS